MSARSGKIVTFYSYKGGTGRSMALANVAWILASAGKSVLVLDWDLEAPGVHRYFRPFLTDPDVASSEGIIDFVTEYCLRAVDMGPDDVTEEWCREQADLDAYTTSLDWSFPSEGGIDFVPAGRQGAEYSTRVNTFDWKRFYDRFRGSLLIGSLRAKLVEDYDYVLVDSRTGVSDTSGICTLQLPDTLAACFTMNNQSIQGMHAALTSIKRQRDETKRPINIYPLPMRIDLGEADRLEVRRRFARQLFEHFLPSTNTLDQKRYWDETEVLGVPIYSYEEILAPFRDSGGAGSVLEAYRHITRYVTGLEVNPKLLQPTDDQRSRILATFAGVVSGREISVATKAEQLYQSFSPADREEFRRIVLELIQLVAPGEDQLREVAEPELMPKVHLVIAARDEGIINVWDPSPMTGLRDSTFKLADRNLLWSWPRLVDWISRERQPQPSLAVVPSTPRDLNVSGPFHRERWGLLAERYAQDRPRRMLSLDGGGVRSIITLGILYAIEQKLSEALRADRSFRLCDYFDYIAGTSTGAMLAAGLARGMRVADIMSFYTSASEQMFEPSHLVKRLQSLYTADPLKARLKEIYGADTDLGPQSLKCLLLVVVKNATMDSTWPISSNPDAKYNDPSRGDCNLRIPLWQLVRASTATPVYFPPEVIPWDPSDPTKTFVFVDGSVTAYGNPAFLLYRMATEPAYRLNWSTGEKNLLLVSVGTGAAKSTGPSAASPNQNVISNVAGIPGSLMSSIQIDQDFNCRTVGRCTYGPVLDREVLDLVPRQVNDGMTLAEQYQAPLVPLTTDLGRRFLYCRYNVDLSAPGLAALRLPKIDPVSVQKTDAVENIPALTEIGVAAGEQVALAHFGPVLELTNPTNTLR